MVYRLGILCFTASIHLSPDKIGSMGVEREGRVEGKKEGRKEENLREWDSRDGGGTGMRARKEIF